MRTTYGMAAVLAVALLAAAGCGLQPGKTQMTFSRGSTPPPPKDVTKPGAYYLYPANSGNPVTNYELGLSDQYGFKKRADGTVVGYVQKKGKEIEIELPGQLATSFYWKYREDD